jgi:pyruvate-formate lyase-activating enzyme
LSAGIRAVARARPLGCPLCHNPQLAEALGVEPKDLLADPTRLHELRQALSIGEGLLDDIADADATN